MLLVALPTGSAGADEIDALLDTLLAQAPQTTGRPEAARAWKQLAKADADRLPALLAALDRADPLAANWIRTAGETIVERQRQQGGRLPADALETFVRNVRHNPRARRLAYEWLVEADVHATDRLLGDMLDDPSIELRRDAVARRIAEAEDFEKADKKTEALAAYRRALASAADVDQIRRTADRLRRLGEKVDLAQVMGFIVPWKLIGPLDNVGDVGYDTAYRPETEIDLTAEYPGKHGAVRWADFTSTDEMGVVDLNRALGAEKGTVAYATAEFHAAHAQEVEFRMSSGNAVKLWLDGRLIDQHHAYHAGVQLDQYVARAVVQKGRHVILVKVCQNEQKQDWAADWGFALRVCDPGGRAVRGE
jgi:hypothetical protein